MKTPISEKDYKDLMDSDCDEYRTAHFAANLDAVQIDIHYTSGGNSVATVCVFDDSVEREIGFISGYRYTDIGEAMRDYLAAFSERNVDIHEFDY